MGDIYRVRSTWTGFIGGPGVTTMYFVDHATALASLHDFWHALADKIPNDVKIQVENVGDVIDSTTGAMTDSWTDDAVDAVQGSGGSGYAAPVGCVIDWLTATVTDGKRLRGRTFVVPLDNSAFAQDGTLTGPALAQVADAASAFQEAQSASFVIWHRGTGSDGTTGLVTSSKVPDMAAVLRSRRD